MQKVSSSATRKPRAVRAGRKRRAGSRPEIVVRRPKFHLDPERSKRWLQGGAATLLLHAVSPAFPAGERFFIKAVMAFKDQIKDPQLLDDIRRFAAQEAAHTRQHIEYDAVVQGHYDLKAIEDGVSNALDEAWKRIRKAGAASGKGPRRALAWTVAMEHVTAILAHEVLKDDRIFDGSDPHFARMWKWHAAEELEHKAVAFDVFEAIGGTWSERSFGMLLASSGFFFGLLLRVVVRLLHADGLLLSPRAWGEILNFAFVSPGIIRRVGPAYLDFFRPGFHPWNRDDRDLLDRWKAGGAVPDAAPA